MANTLLTIDMVTKEALRIAHEKAPFIGTINRQYDSEFAKIGGKIGSTLRIRLPNQYTVRSGSRIMDVQDQEEASTTMTVATQNGVDMQFYSDELALSIDDFSMRYIEPAMSVLIGKLDGDVLQTATQDTFNQAGTAGTIVGASGDISALGTARARINENLAPKDSRNFQIDSVTMASIVNANKGLFEPGGQIAEAFREGLYGRNAMADWYENERTYTHTNGSDVSGITLDTVTLVNGDASAAITGAGAAPAVGSIFTFATGNAVHPETKANLSRLQQFVVLSGTTTTLLNFSPAIYSSGAKQNVSVMPGTTSALTWVGSASTGYKQNLMYHRDAFAFVTADLPLMADAASCVRDSKDGISLRVWKGSDIINDRLLMRIDILYGFKSIRPAWACRITN